MAKKPRRRNPNFAVIKIVAAVAVGALANDGITTVVLTGTLDDHRVISADLAWSIRDHTAGEGPLQFGLQSADLTAAETLEAVVASPTGRGDVIAIERARRPVRQVGQFHGADTEEVFNDGRLKRTKCGWIADEGLNGFFVNRSGAQLTTGTVMTITGKVYLVWT